LDERIAEIYSMHAGRFAAAWQGQPPPACAMNPRISSSVSGFLTARIGLRI